VIGAKINFLNTLEYYYFGGLGDATIAEMRFGGLYCNAIGAKRRWDTIRLAALALQRSQQRD
jgi:hypothetical protein